MLPTAWTLTRIETVLFVVTVLGLAGAGTWASVIGWNLWPRSWISHSGGNEKARRHGRRASLIGGNEGGQRPNAGLPGPWRRAVS